MSKINLYNHFIKGTVFLFLFLLISGSAFSQTKVGYIDSKKIIDNMQEAKDAKTKLDNLVVDWQKEMTVLQDSVKKMKEDYDKKKLILTEQMKTDLEKKIKDVDDMVVNFRSQKFGDNGEYSQKQIEFMRPVYDKIFKAIEIVAKQDDFDYVFDRSGDFLLLFVNEKYDLTGKVQRILEGKK